MWLPRRRTIVVDKSVTALPDAQVRAVLAHEQGILRHHIFEIMTAAGEDHATA